MRLVRTVLTAATCAMLAACATPAPVKTAVPAPPAAAPVSLDGVYWGTSTWFRADRRDCPRPGLVKLTVQDGKFQYRWNYHTVVDASIAPDGDVLGQAPDITLVGHRKGRVIEGDVTNGYCGLHFTVTRRKP